MPRRRVDERHLFVRVPHALRGIHVCSVRLSALRTNAPKASSSHRNSHRTSSLCSYNLRIRACSCSGEASYSQTLLPLEDNCCVRSNKRELCVSGGRPEGAEGTKKAIGGQRVAIALLREAVWFVVAQGQIAGRQLPCAQLNRAFCGEGSAFLASA